MVMKNLEANGSENSGRICGPGPLHYLKRSCLALLAVVASLLFGSIFIVGCTTDQSKGDRRLSDFEYRIQYPRRYYDTADSLTRFEMDKENAVISRGSK